MNFSRAVVATSTVVMLSNAVASWGVTIDWVSVADPGNEADTVVMRTDGTTGYGNVDRVYQIGKFEVTNGQYVEFLNAVAATDVKPDQ